MLRIHKEGTPTLLLASAILCFALFAVWYPAVVPVQAKLVLTVIITALYATVVLFFRVPVRNPASDLRSVLAPADGKVVAIEEVVEEEYFKDKRLQISIFMSPLNVHVNYHPVSGTTTYCKYHPGKYLVAWHPKSSLENERSTVVVRTPSSGEVLFRQIAGALARRICTYAEPDQVAIGGSQFGFIKFGSRVDVFLPLGTEPCVTLGQKVRGADTVIARFP
ncbi:MAG: phosphatidylserine decarboxylase family protein [Flavobacteriales bacterium]|nr:phosphatidylserine decarboxylase family protein [Flavobacteriales bacterium]